MQRLHCGRRTAGFTVTELMVAVGIAAIVLALAIPSFRSLMADNRMVLTGNGVRNAALIARSTAVSLNRQITFCAGRLERGCHGDWSSHEWLVFDDRDRDGVVDTDERVHLTERQTPSANVSISSNGPFNNRVIFTRSGTAVTANGAFAAGRVRLCVDRGGAGNAIDLVLIGSGRMESERRTIDGGCSPL